MLNKNSNHDKAIYVVTLISILFTASGLRAEERLSASETLTERTMEFLSDRGRTGSLLGSIIAGAAVANPLAPLLGSVAGFMIGKSSAFSDKDSNAAQRQAYLNRSLMPEDGVQITSLTGLTGKQPQASEPALIPGLSGETEMGDQSQQAEQIVIVELPGETERNIQSEQTEQTATWGLTGETAAENQSEQTEPVVIVGLSGIRTGNQSEQNEQPAALEMTRKTEVGNNLQQQLADACSNAQLTQPLSSSCYYYSQ